MNGRNAFQMELLEPTGANVGFESTLWATSDMLRGNMDPSDYKHVVMGLIFLKYVSDAFDERKGGRSGENGGAQLAVPEGAHWSTVTAHADDQNIGETLDSAMAEIERANPPLKGVLPVGYGRRGLDQRRVGGVVKLIGTIRLGDKSSRSRDVLGRVYEYFLSEFASAEGKRGGEFYTPRCVVRLLVHMLAPYKGVVYDPCCGSGGMFVQSEQFIERHGGRVGDIRVFGQESNLTTWRLARMNLEMRGIPANLGAENANSFHRDLHEGLRADYILANPPFNDTGWGVEHLRRDGRWSFGLPPANNANYAWVQHFIHHLAPTGLAGFVLANGSLTSNQSGEGDIRGRVVEADLVDCIVGLPDRLFYSTQIPVCLWFIAKDKIAPPFRDRRARTLFIDARGMGAMVDRVHRELSEVEIERIASTYHRWRGDGDAADFSDIPGFAKSAALDDIRAHKYALVPGRYVGFERPASPWTIGELQAEVAEMQRRVQQIREATEQSWKVIRGLVHG
jgi:type I restriction enzyme M protein